MGGESASSSSSSSTSSNKPCLPPPVPSLGATGRNDYGQLGQGDYDDRGDTALSMGDNLAPIDLGTTPGGTGSAVAVAVTTGQQFTCVLLEGGSVLVSCLVCAPPPPPRLP